MFFPEVSGDGCGDSVLSGGGCGLVALEAVGEGGVDVVNDFFEDDVFFWFDDGFVVDGVVKQGDGVIKGSCLCIGVGFSGLGVGGWFLVCSIGGIGGEDEEDDKEGEYADS